MTRTALIAIGFGLLTACSHRPLRPLAEAPLEAPRIQPVQIARPTLRSIASRQEAGIAAPLSEVPIDRHRLLAEMIVGFCLAGLLVGGFSGALSGGGRKVAFASAFLLATAGAVAGNVVFHKLMAFL